MRKPKFRWVLMVLIATVAGMLLTASASSAATSAGSTPAQADHVVKQTEAMYQVPVKKLVSSKSDKPGWGTIQLANGETVPVPQADEKKVMSRAAQEAASPDDTVYGNCGSSSIYVNDKPNDYPVAMKTGFTVYTWATSYYWNASVDGPGYSHVYQSGGFLDFDTSWEGGYQSSQNLSAGFYTANVNFGIAYLWDGDICISLLPSDFEFLTAPAKCLSQRPAGGRVSGNGWIDNTVIDVKHRNITTTPNGPGTRAATATACLRLKLGPGSDATGNITGWQDAQVFARAHGYHPATDNSLARCHLIANILGGKGGILDGGQNNLVPCWQLGTNITARGSTRPSMLTYETMVRTAVGDLAANEAVYFKVTPEYRNSASTIPYAIVMTAEVQYTDGTSSLLFSRVVTNVPDAHPTLNLGN